MRDMAIMHGDDHPAEYVSVKIADHFVSFNAINVLQEFWLSNEQWDMTGNLTPYHRICALAATLNKA